MDGRRLALRRWDGWAADGVEEVLELCILRKPCRWASVDCRSVRKITLRFALRLPAINANECSRPFRNPKRIQLVKRLFGGSRRSRILQAIYFINLTLDPEISVKRREASETKSGSEVSLRIIEVTCSLGSISTIFEAFRTSNTSRRRSSCCLAPTAAASLPCLAVLRRLKSFVKGDSNVFTQSTRTRWVDSPTQVFELEATLDRQEIRVSPGTGLCGQ